MELVYKLEGETPLEAIERLREEKKMDADIPLSYAGRLDPMAKGLMPVLVGNEENQHRTQYLRLDKQYRFDVLFGVQTDTFDVLGLITEIAANCRVPEGQLSAVATAFAGKQTMKYPPYSAKTVDGEPLWKHARKGDVTADMLPEQDIEIYSFDIDTVYTQESAALLEESVTRIQKASGDFRQKQCIATWKKALTGNDSHTFDIATCTLSCSSGTYVRRIAQKMGTLVGCGAIAWQITRTRVGTYTLDDIAGTK